MIKLSDLPQLPTVWHWNHLNVLQRKRVLITIQKNQRDIRMYRLGIFVMLTASAFYFSTNFKIADWVMYVYLTFMALGTIYFSFWMLVSTNNLHKWLRDEFEPEELADR